MRVLTSHHVDAGDGDTAGRYDFHYEYDILVFQEGELSLVARSYTDKASEAHFLRAEVNSESRGLTQMDLQSGLAAEALAYLRLLGKVEINWLSEVGGGYEPVAIARK